MLRGSTLQKDDREICTEAFRSYRFMILTIFLKYDQNTPHYGSKEGKVTQ